MSKTNFDSIELSGDLTVKNVTAENISASGTLDVDGLLTADGNIALASATDTLFAVSAADATTAETACTLANEVKAKHNALLAFLRTGTLPAAGE